jgi:hypothetical protein
MNHRCYRCGWSFTLGREAIEAAVAQAGKEKTYALPCPRCRQINKIPVQQLRRNLPPGWTPPAPAEETPAEPPAMEAPVAEPAPEPAVAEAEADKPAPKKRKAPATKAASRKTSKVK